MRIEAENWWKQAKADLKTAENLLNSKDYYACVFFCQQAVEKGLKAAYLQDFKKVPPKIHDLVELCRLVQSPKEITADASAISPAYIFSRYPDAGTEIPSLFYDEQKAKENLHKAKIVFQWIEKKIKL